MVAVRVLIAACLFIITDSSSSPKWRVTSKFAGPYQLIPRAVDDCEDPGTNEMRVLSSKLSKIGRNKYNYSTDVILPYGASDDIDVQFMMAVFGNSGWKDNYIVQNVKHLCAAGKYWFPAGTKYVLKKLGYKDCPILPGNYTLNSNILDNPRFPPVFSTMIYNRYRAQVSFLKDGKKIGCKRADIDCVPK